MAQPQFFAGVLLVVHRHGEGQVAFHAVQHGDAAGEHFHGSRRQLVVQGVAGPGPDFPFNLQHGFAAQMLGDGEGVGAQIRVHRDLHRAAAVPQVDENHPAVITASIHPAAQLHLLINVLFAQVAATVAAHGMSQLEKSEFPTAAVSFRRVCRRACERPLPAGPCRGSQRSVRCRAWRGTGVRRPGRSPLPGWVTRCRW